MTIESDLFTVTHTTGDILQPGWTNSVKSLLLDKRITAAETSAGVTPTNYAYRPDPRIEPERFEFSKSGTASANTTALQKAIDLASENGTAILLPDGPHSINACTIEADGVSIIGGSRYGTRLYAGSGSIAMLRITGSYCTVEKVRFHGNSQSGVYGLVVADDDITQTSTVTYHNYNTFRDLWFSGLAEAIMLKPGPDVSGTDSQLFYNNFDNIHIYQCTRGIWLREGTNAGSSGPNRNFFRGIRVGESGANVGIHLEAGDTNMFSQVSFEGIASGTSPLGTPTGLKILDTDANGNSLLYNMFSQCFWEGCTRDLENANVYSEFFQCFPNASKTVWTAVPHYFLGGYLAGGGPMQSLHGYVFQSNAENAGYPDDVAFFPGGGGAPASTGFLLGAGGPKLVAGSGSPEGVVTAPQGSVYMRTDGSTSTSIYIKTSGSGNTGWTAK